MRRHAHRFSPPAATQGRARPTLAKLYNWRYRSLGDLPNVSTVPAFTVANPGFALEFQLIDVPDYNGRGESSPLPYFYQVRCELRPPPALVAGARGRWLARLVPPPLFVTLPPPRPSPPPRTWARPSTWCRSTSTCGCWGTLPRASAC